jgi:SprB repeat/Secretion system C-terminal sorting domain
MNPAWVQGGALVRTFPTVGAPQGTTYLQQAGNTSHYSGSMWSFAPVASTYISWWAKTSTNNSNCSYVVVGDASISTNNGIVFSYFTSLGTLRFYNNTLNFEIPTTANTWYHVELLNVNYTAHTYDLYINGVLMQSNYAFRSLTTSSISQIHLYNFDPGSNGYYDEIIVGSTPLAFAPSHTDVLCNGDSTGSAGVSITSGTQPFSYLWSNGATTSSLSALGQGTYMVTVTDGNGCTSTQSIVVAEPSGLTDSVMWSAPTCSYNTDGTIGLSLSGGTPGYSYLWSTGDTSQNVSGLGGGTFTVAYTDANGCGDTDTITLSAPAVLTFTCLPTDVLCNGMNNGALDVTATGGTPGYSYLWSNGMMTEDLSGLAPGNYSLVLTDQNGCMHSDSFAITEPTLLSASVVVTSDDGTSNGAIDFTLTGGVGPYTYLWSNGATTQDVTNLATGNYTVTATDANGCNAIISIIVDLVVGVGAQVGMDVQAWPNPCSQSLHLKLPTMTEVMAVRLYDLRGTLVFERQGLQGGLQELDLRAVAAGSYLLKVSNGVAMQTLRVSKLD